MADLEELLQKVRDDGYDTDVARNLVLESKEDHIDEVIDALFEHEGEYFFRYVMPWLPGKSVTKKLIQLLGRMDSEFQSHLYWIADHLLNSDISEDKDDFIEQISRIIKINDDSLTRGVMNSCHKFISEDLAELLLSILVNGEGVYVAPIIYNSSINNVIPNLKKLIDAECVSCFRNKSLQPLLIRCKAEALTEAF